jgi:PilZ domain
MSTITLPTIDAVLENAPYSVRLAARRAHRMGEATGADRRVHPRILASDIQWLRSVRVKNGPDVTLVDLSSGGVLLDTGAQLRPGARITLEIVGTARIEVASQVLRCHVAALRDSTAIYRGACAFVHPVELERIQELPAASIPAQNGLSTQAWQKIVVRYRDGALLKGYTLDFHPSRGHFSLWPSINATASDRVLVPMSRLKAIFFVRDFQGNPAYTQQEIADAPGGRRIEVTFQDREVIQGTTLSYRPDGTGFFVIPHDTRGNNQRIFVVGAAVRHVRFP